MKKEDVMARNATRRTGGARSTATGKGATRSVTAPRPLPSKEEIARRAYEIYLERNGQAGNAFDDWVEAERQLTVEADRHIIPRSA
jgi:hypothetical protein